MFHFGFDKQPHKVLFKNIFVNDFVFANSKTCEL